MIWIRERCVQQLRILLRFLVKTTTRYIYISVARLKSVQLICAIAIAQGLYLWQIDYVSKGFSKSYIELCKKHMTRLRILPVHIKVINTINCEQSHKFGYRLLMINSYLPQLGRMMSQIPYQLRKVKFQLSQNLVLAIKLKR